MNKVLNSKKSIKASHSGHRFHLLWTARLALQLVFPRDNLYKIVVEGLSPQENINLGNPTEEIADLSLYYGNGNTLELCEKLIIVQFKYKIDRNPVTASYLKKTLEKFSETLREIKEKASDQGIVNKLSFSFVTNANFSPNLEKAIICLVEKSYPSNKSVKRTYEYLQKICLDNGVSAEELFSLIAFPSSRIRLPSLKLRIRKTLSNWSGSSGLEGKRLNELSELIQDRFIGDNNRTIKREDILEALDCDEEQLFPAESKFVDIGNVFDRECLQEFKDKVINTTLPVFLHSDGGIGKTVFVQSLEKHLSENFQIILFDCFAGGTYRTETLGNRHLPQYGLLQIINELATQGYCDPLLPGDYDQFSIIRVTRKRLNQAIETLNYHHQLKGLLIILDAADNAQLVAEEHNQLSFPKLLLESLSTKPIEGVKLILTARTHRMENVIAGNKVKCHKLEPFTKEETKRFLESKRKNITNVELITAFKRSGGNARVLNYLVKTWRKNVVGIDHDSEISVEEIIQQICEDIENYLHIQGWSEIEVRKLYAALRLLPPPIPIFELTKILNWSESQVKSAISDLAPMLSDELNGVIFRDEPTDTYFKEHYADDVGSQQAIVQSLQNGQKNSIYAAEVLPDLLVHIGDNENAYKLVDSDEYPCEVHSVYEKYRIKKFRLKAAFSLATNEQNLDQVLKLALYLSQVVSANTRGDLFIRNSPSLATILGDTNVSRRLFGDSYRRKGPGHARLIVHYCFLGDLEEALIHQDKVIKWIIGYQRKSQRKKHYAGPKPSKFDFAAVLFLDVLKNDFSKINFNVTKRNINSVLQVLDELISFCSLHEKYNSSDVLKRLTKFATSKDCTAFTLQIALLSNEWGLSNSEIRALTRAASKFSNHSNLLIEDTVTPDDFKHERDLTEAALTSLMINSRNSSKQILKPVQLRRPPSYFYTRYVFTDQIWDSIKSICIKTWLSGCTLSYHHILPKEVNSGKKTSSIHSYSEMKMYLENLTVKEIQVSQRIEKLKGETKQFTQYEINEILKGMDCILKLVKPIEEAILLKGKFTTNDLSKFLYIWKTNLPSNKPFIHHVANEHLAHNLGIQLVKILLRHCTIVEEKEAKKLVKILKQNTFLMESKLEILSLLARKIDLGDISGKYAGTLSEELQHPDYLHNQGKYFLELAQSLIPLSIQEAKEYYSEGLSQISQKGVEDLDQIYPILDFAEKQQGGYIKPKQAHHLMNLCHLLIQEEPEKFRWTLFGSAAANSIGFPAIYKIIRCFYQIRWYNQASMDYHSVADFSFGLPHLVCDLTKKKHMDARRASVLLALCKGHQWFDWNNGEELRSLLIEAQSKDRLAIFSLAVERQLIEFDNVGWSEHNQEILLNFVDKFKEIREGISGELKVNLNRLEQGIKSQRNNENDITNYNILNLCQDDEEVIEETIKKNEIKKIYNKCIPISESSLDEAIISLPSEYKHFIDSKKYFFDLVRQYCPYDDRVKVIEAISKTAELNFFESRNLMIELIQEWGDTSKHLNNNKSYLIKLLFDYKGYDLFKSAYTDISKEIERFAILCNEPKLVIHLVLQSIVNENLELSGEQWLQLATSLTSCTKPTTSLKALENLLSNSKESLDYEIGEGSYKTQLVGNSVEGEIVADIIWYLLGDEDSFIRWQAARSIESLLKLGLLEDIEKLINRFDVDKISSLDTDNHNFAYLNAQQWLLMGLARASIHYPEKLKPLKPKLEVLSKRQDLHILNQVHMARCLKNIEGKSSLKIKHENFLQKVFVPVQGIIENNRRSGMNFSKNDFDYEYHQYKIPELANLFGISINEAANCLINEVKKQWPGKNGMSDFPFDRGYFSDSDERYETYRGHIQKHALIQAATKLVKSNPVIRASYEEEESNPWQTYLKNWDVSFNDGSWLADHKDNKPIQAREDILIRKESNTTFQVADKIFHKLGFTEGPQNEFLPLYGSWDFGVGGNIYFVAAVTNEWGSIKECKRLSKQSRRDLWLPTTNSEGYEDKFRKNNSNSRPLIWLPECYPIGIDNEEEWATRGPIIRPRLSLPFISALRLKPDRLEKQWYDINNTLVLKSEVWGKWEPTTSSHRFEQDEGMILWAKRGWIDKVLKSCKKSLIYYISLRYNNSYIHSGSSASENNIYVGLKQSEKEFRYWFAKKASFSN